MGTNGLVPAPSHGKQNLITVFLIMIKRAMKPEYEGSTEQLLNGNYSKHHEYDVACQ